MITKINLEKQNTIWTDNNQIIVGQTIKQVIDYANAHGVDNLLSVQWQVVENAPVTVNKQNATMLQRANKIANGLNKEVQGFDTINDVTYGCVII